MDKLLNVCLICCKSAGSVLCTGWRHCSPEICSGSEYRGYWPYLKCKWRDSPKLILLTEIFILRGGTIEVFGLMSSWQIIRCGSCSKVVQPNQLRTTTGSYTTPTARTS